MPQQQWVILSQNGANIHTGISTELFQVFSWNWIVYQKLVLLLTSFNFLQRLAMSEITKQTKNQPLSNPKWSTV